MACSPASPVYNLGYQWALTSFKLGWELFFVFFGFSCFSNGYLSRLTTATRVFPMVGLSFSMIYHCIGMGAVFSLGPWVFPLGGL